MRWVITGTSRGIGLELARQLLERGDVVDAAARKPEESRGLAELRERHQARLRLVACDVSSDASVASFAEALAPGDVDVLVNNAGIMGRRAGIETVDPKDVIATFDTNAVGPLRVTRALLPRLKKGAKVAAITSGMGSIEDNTSGGAYGYRMSKAALNMAMRSMSVDFRDRGIVAVTINPGWVVTDMGGAGAPTPVETSAANIIRLVDGLGMGDTGKFLDHTGRTWPW